MKKPSSPNALGQTGRWAAALVAAALLPAVSQEPASLPFISGQLTVLDPTGAQGLALNVEAHMVEQGFFYLPAGTILVSLPDGDTISFDVNGLEFVHIESEGIIAGTQANLSGRNLERDLTLHAQVFQENPEAARHLPADYHLPFAPGDCVTYLKIGDTEYQVDLFPWLSTHLTLDASPLASAE
jgi:hypothetical protein